MVKCLPIGGGDGELFGSLLTKIGEQGANIILRLHDSYRYTRDYIVVLKKLVAEHDNVLLKFKNSSPDNFLDMQVADGLITNFSSIANLYYGTRKPTIHIYPVADEDQEFMWRRYTPIGIYKKKVESVRFIWKLSPEENGGLVARSFSQLLWQVEQLITEPQCCCQKVDDFLDKHMIGADGRNCERIWDVLTEF